jgi:hypothetical protein
MGAKREKEFFLSFLSFSYLNVGKEARKSFTGGCAIFKDETGLDAPKSKFALTNFPAFYLELCCIFHFHTHTSTDKRTEGEKLCRNRAFFWLSFVFVWIHLRNSVEKKTKEKFLLSSSCMRQEEETVKHDEKK